MAHFETVRLDATADEVRERIEETVKGLRVSEDGRDTLFRDAGGVAVAAIRETDDGLELRYRTGPRLSRLGNAARKGRRIRDAVEDCLD